MSTAHQPPSGSSGPWFPAGSQSPTAGTPLPAAPSPETVVPVVHAGPATAAFAAPVTPSAVARWDRTGSRYGSGATSFGLTGRIVITVVTVLVGIWLAVTNVLGLGVFLLVAAWVLRDLWRPTHRPTPLPPSTSAPAPSQRFAQDASSPFGGPPAT